MENELDNYVQICYNKQLNEATKSKGGRTLTDSELKKLAELLSTVDKTIITKALQETLEPARRTKEQEVPKDIRTGPEDRRNHSRFKKGPVTITHHYLCKCCGYSWVEDHKVEIKSKHNAVVTGNLHFETKTCHNCLQHFLNCDHEATVNYLISFINTSVSFGTWNANSPWRSTTEPVPCPSHSFTIHPLEYLMEDFG